MPLPPCLGQVKPSNRVDSFLTTLAAHRNDLNANDLKFILKNTSFHFEMLAQSSVGWPGWSSKRSSHKAQKSRPSCHGPTQHAAHVLVAVIPARHVRLLTRPFVPHAALRELLNQEEKRSPMYLAAIFSSFFPPSPTSHGKTVTSRPFLHSFVLLFGGLTFLLYVSFAHTQRKLCNAPTTLKLDVLKISTKKD